MKKAFKIKNDYYKVKLDRDKSQTTVLYITEVTFDDDTTKTFRTIEKVSSDGHNEENPAWAKKLEKIVENYDEFINNIDKWKKSGKYIATQHPAKYLESTTVGETEDIIDRVKEIDVTRVVDQDEDLAIAAIREKNGYTTNVVCNYEELEDVLEQKVNKYEKLVRKNKVVIDDDTRKSSEEVITEEKEQAKADKLDEYVQILVGRVAKEDSAIIYFASPETNLYLKKEVSLESAKKYIKDANKKGIDIAVEYLDKESKESLTEEEVKEIVSKRNAENERKKSVGEDIIKNLRKQEREQASGKTETNKAEKKQTEKKNDSKTEKEVKKVVIYSFIGEDNRLFEQAILFYNDGTVKSVDVDTAQNEVFKAYNRMVARGEKIDSKFLEIVSGSELSKNWEKYKAEATMTMSSSKQTKKTGASNMTMSNKEKEEKKKSEKEEIADQTVENNTATAKTTTPANHASKTTKPKKKIGFFTKVKNGIKKYWKKAVAAITAVALAVGGVVLFASRDKNKIENENNKTTQSDKNTKNINNENNNNNDKQQESIKYETTYDILNALVNTNKERYDFLRGVGSTLTEYNTATANKYYETGKNTKLAHSYEELMMEYVLYNGIDGSDINQIFGSEYLDANHLKESFKNATIQDGYAHNLQTINLDRSNLLKTEEAQNFYVRYNNLFTGMNNVDEASIKVNSMKEFCDMVRQDFPGMKKADYNNIKPYQLTILEYYQASKNMEIKPDNWFTEKELKYLDGLYTNVANKKIEEIVVIQNARALVEEKTTLPEISDYFNILISDLKDSDDYNVNTQETNISNYDSYKLHVKGTGKVKEEKKETKKEEKKEETTNNNNNTNNSNNNNNSSNYNYNNNDYYYQTPVNTTPVTESEEITYESDEEYTFEFDFSDQTNKEVTFESDTQEETITSEEEITIEVPVVSLDDYVEDDEVTYPQTTTEEEITFDQTTTDENGKLQDSYSGVTTDGEGAVTPNTELPDPNKETENSSNIVNGVDFDIITDFYGAEETQEEDNSKTLTLKL